MHFVRRTRHRFAQTSAIRKSCRRLGRPCRAPVWLTGCGHSRCEVTTGRIVPGMRAGDACSEPLICDDWWQVLVPPVGWPGGARRQAFFLTGREARRFNTRPLQKTGFRVFLTRLGQVAQLVEQRTENPRVVGSIPTLATIFTFHQTSADIYKVPENQVLIASSRSPAYGRVQPQLPRSLGRFNGSSLGLNRVTPCGRQASRNDGCDSTTRSFETPNQARGRESFPTVTGSIYWCSRTGLAGGGRNTSSKAESRCSPSRARANTFEAVTSGGTDTPRANRDPVIDLKAALPPIKHLTMRRSPIQVRSVRLLRGTGGYQGKSPVVQCALRLLPLVFVRSAAEAVADNV